MEGCLDGGLDVAAAVGVCVLAAVLLKRKACTAVCVVLAASVSSSGVVVGVLTQW
jgi:hypothetical protein